MITSRSNPLIKQIRRLGQKKHRQKEGLGYVEGLRPVLTAAEYRPDLIEKLIIAPDLLTTEVVAEKLESWDSDPRRVELSAALFKDIAQRENPAGIGALVRSPLCQLDQLQPKADQTRFILLDRISDPGNLGTILRTADAAGIDGVVLSGPGADLLHPTALKASLGTAFTLPMAAAEHASLLAWAAAQRLTLIATSAKGAHDYQEADYPAHTLLLLGNEREGLHPTLLDAAEIKIKIPMRGQATSLNVAVAAGILMYQIY